MNDGGGLRTLDALSLNLEEVRDGEWNSDRLQGLDLVVFANAQNISEDNMRALKGFVRGGGGVLLFPGDRVTGRGASFSKTTSAATRLFCRCALKTRSAKNIAGIDSIVWRRSISGTRSFPFSDRRKERNT